MDYFLSGYECKLLLVQEDIFIVYLKIPINSGTVKRELNLMKPANDSAYCESRMVKTFEQS